MIGGESMKMIELRRDWYKCPHCGKNLLIYNNTAACEGVFIRCKGCKKEVEIVIQAEQHPLLNGGEE